jgi:quinol monooxygenase YgiN
VAIKVIVELRAEPGRRGDLLRLLEGLVETHGPSQRGFLGSTRYEVLEDPDTLVEIADWESAEARAAHMAEVAATGAYAPLLELLAAPFRATVVRQLP